MVQINTTALHWAEVNFVLKLFMFINTCIDPLITMQSATNIGKLKQGNIFTNW